MGLVLAEITGDLFVDFCSVTSNTAYTAIFAPLCNGMILLSVLFLNWFVADVVLNSETIWYMNLQIHCGVLNGKW